MGVPRIIDDGNWYFRQPMSIEYEFPFSDKGDNATFHAYATYRMDKDAFRPLPSMSVANFSLGGGYLTQAGNPRDIGCGLYEFTDRFSNVPATRSEYGTYSFTEQFYEAATDSDVDPDKYFYKVTYDVEEQTFTVPCEWVYEYFLFNKPQPLLKQRVFLLFGLLYNIGGIPYAQSRLIAEDSEISIYGGKIFQRKTPYVQVQSTAIR